MSNEARYFEVLAGSIAQVEEDSFEARGVVYDRLWGIVCERLRKEGQASAGNLAAERAAFLSAVRRIEFGERLAVTPAGQAPARQLPQESAPQDRVPQEKTPQEKRRSKRSVSGRIVARMAFACVVLAAVGLAYLVIDAASAERSARDGGSVSWQAQLTEAALSVGNLFGRRPPMVPRGPAQRAVYYEENSATATGHTFSGRAVWRGQAGSGTGSGPEAVLSIDAEVPQKKLLLKVSIRRAPDGGGAISHFVEFNFLNPDGSASDVVDNVLGILMKNDELSPGIELAGKVTRVHRGIFLMGLSGAAPDLGRNLKLLKERPWLDIPIVMKDRTRGILAIEKGATGQASIDRIFASWGHS
ncbi:MAG: hypothetical protein K2Y71_22630 [Xanthobacteraceae bacterium]|nr:hypothetical protein [Xanthobacteraceae bacterium]